MAKTQFSLNQVTLIGKVGNEPDSKPVGESTVLSFSLATDYSYKNKQGEYERKTDWHNIVVWNGSDFLSQSIRKGITVSITGSIRYEQYEKDGEKKYITKIIADTVIPMKAFSTDAPKEQNDDLPF